MLRIVIFELLQLGVSAFAIWRGGAPERIVGWMLLAAALTSLAAGAYATVGVSEVHFGIDLILLAGVFAVALRANRWWPYWVAALQLIVIGVHGARAIDPSLVPIVYARGSGEIAYPMCLALAIGTWHFVRRARRDGIAPRSWSPLRWA